MVFVIAEEVDIPWRQRCCRIAIALVVGDLGVATATGHQLCLGLSRCLDGSSSAVLRVSLRSPHADLKGPDRAASVERRLQLRMRSLDHTSFEGSLSTQAPQIALLMVPVHWHTLIQRSEY